jgi:GntR family transcriptional regulator
MGSEKVKGREVEGFLEKYRPEIPGLPRYAQLRETLLAAIDDGHWSPGSRMPNEMALASMSPYSLGTVQKAMRDLVQSGVVVRRRGEGTFVAQRRVSMSSPLHLRFEADSGKALPVYPRIVARERVRSQGPWKEFFRGEAQELLRIDRVFAVGKLFEAFSSIYLDDRRFPLFGERLGPALESRNFKDVLRREYNISIQRIHQHLRVEALPASVCSMLGLRKGTCGARLQLSAVGSGGRPVYYQEAFIPPNPCVLRLSDWTQGL